MAGKGNKVYTADMKYGFVFLLIVAVVSLAVFGAFAMSHAMGEINCLARTAAGGNVCPEAAGTAGVAAFHLNLLKSFSAANIIPWVGLLLFIIAAFGIAVPNGATLPFLSRQSFVAQGASAARQRAPRFFRWLTIRERRNPSLS